MAYFDCIVGGGSATSTITVAYDSSFYNKTMTCSNGIDTYTQTTTSSGVTEFEVDTEGTWTITCNGVSQTVEVVFNYTLTMAVTKTITVHSAANDTLYFVDAMGSKTVTTDSSGQGSVTISVVLGDSITFTSSVAKNPDALALNYTKSVVIDANTTDVYIMPEHTLYWWGNFISQFTATNTRQNDSGGQRQTPSVSIGVNSVNVGNKTGSAYQGSYLSNTLTDVTNLSNLRLIVSSLGISGTYGGLQMVATTDTTAHTTDHYSANSINIQATSSFKAYQLDISNLAGSCIGGMGGTSSWDCNMSALWYE